MDGGLCWDDGEISRRRERRNNSTAFFILLKGGELKMKCKKCEGEMIPFISDGSSYYVCENCMISVQYLSRDWDKGDSLYVNKLKEKK